MTTDQQSGLSTCAYRETERLDGIMKIDQTVYVEIKTREYVLYDDTGPILAIPPCLKCDCDKPMAPERR